MAKSEIQKDNLVVVKMDAVGRAAKEYLLQWRPGMNDYTDDPLGRIRDEYQRNATRRFIGIVRIIIFAALFMAAIFFFIGIRRTESITTHKGDNPMAVPQSKIPIWKVLLAEGASEGAKGMYAIGCVIRNRGGSLKGFAGAKRKDLDAFITKQGPELARLAQNIEKEIFIDNATDITGGATLFENIEAFGFPKSWDKSKVSESAKIGRHTFYREK